MNISKNLWEKTSIKDFRTYAANYYFIKNLLSETNKRTPNTEKAIKKNISNAIKTTAYYMKHTKSISKKSYIMSFCIEMYEDNPELFVEYKNEDPDDFLIETEDVTKIKSNDNEILF
jgi:capsid portal protein